MTSCVTKDELNNLEERFNKKQERIEDKISDICKGQSRMSERIIKIEATTDSLKECVNSFNTRLIEQKEDIIKEITLLALSEGGDKLFKNKMQVELGKGLMWFLGITIVAVISTAIGFLTVT